MKSPFRNTTTKVAILFILVGLAGLTGYFWSVYPSPTLVFSIPIRLAAFAIAMAALIYWKDWRIMLLAVMFLLMAMRQTLTLFIRSELIAHTEITRMISEIPGFLVTLLAFLSIIYLWKIFSYREKARQAERALQESEEKFRLFSEYSNDWEYWQNNENNLVYSSPSFEKITGYPAAEFENESRLMREIIHPDDLHIWEKHSHEKPAGPELSPIEFRIIRKDREIRWIHHMCQPIYDALGKNMGIRASNRDITEIKLLREEIKKLQNILPICASCKKIRDDKGYWNQVEEYISKHSEIQFSHSLCPLCAQKLYPEFYKKDGDKNDG